MGKTHVRRISPANGDLLWLLARPAPRPPLSLSLRLSYSSPFERTGDAAAPEKDWPVTAKFHFCPASPLLRGEFLRDKSRTGGRIYSISWILVSFFSKESLVEPIFQRNSRPSSF